MYKKILSFAWRLFLMVAYTVICILTSIKMWFNLEWKVPLTWRIFLSLVLIYSAVSTIGFFVFSNRFILTIL